MGTKKITATDAVDKVIEILPKHSCILDIGAGASQKHAKIFRSNGLNVDTVDFFAGSTYVGDFNSLTIPTQYDLVWSAHCLEHQLNINLFLRKVFDCVKVGGYAAITVPPLKHQIVGGHVNLWNAGLLVYNLVLAGFDCSDVKLKKYGYNITAIVRRTDVKIPFEKLIYDTADLVTLNDYFPKGLDYEKNCVFDGNIDEYNWL